MGHGLILYESSRGGQGGGEGCSSGADFTLENSGNGAGKEELRPRGGLLCHVSTQKEPSVREREKERERIRIRGIVAERGEKDGERTKRGGWSETEMKGEIGAREGEKEEETRRDEVERKCRRGVEQNEGVRAKGYYTCSVVGSLFIFPGQGTGTGRLTCRRLQRC